MRRRVAAVVVASLLVLAAAVSIFSFSGAVFPSATAKAASRALSFLGANYNRSIGMIPEVPKGNTYFVYSDNFLAAYVLEEYGNSTLRAVAANITSTDNRYLATVPDPTNQYQVISSTNGSFFASNDHVVARVGSAVIETTLNNGTAPLSPANYSDIAFLEALFFHQLKNRGDAAAEFALGAKLYDGHGLNDAATSGGEYQTFKLALYDYAGNVLGEAVPAAVQADLLRLQAPDGGFHTGYQANLSTDGTSENTETTSLAILALETQGPKAGIPALDFALFVMAIGLLVVLEVFVMRRRGASGQGADHRR